MADVFYQQLISATRSQDVGLYFYRRELEKQKATEDDFLRISIYYGTKFIELYNEILQSSNSVPTDEKIGSIIKESMEYAKQQFEKK